MKLSKWFWGLFFLMAGICIIFSHLGYLGNINLFTLFFTVFLIPIIIKGLKHLNFGEILLPLAIIAILYDKQLGIEALTPWPILITAVLVSIGLTILFSGSKKYHHYQTKCHSEHFDRIIDEQDDNIVGVSVNFGSSIKYVNSNALKHGEFHASFGALKVYFDHTIIDPEGAEIEVTASFAGIELYIPKEWHVINQISTSLGGVEEKNKPVHPEGPKVMLKGSASFSGIDIIYI